MQRALVSAVLLGIASVFMADFAPCLPDPATAFCPSCPSLLMCFTVSDWVNYFLFVL